MVIHDLLSRILLAACPKAMEMQQGSERLACDLDASCSLSTDEKTTVEIT